jgi:hypothetical protein
LPRLGSRVRIPSPAPNLFKEFSWIRGGRREGGFIVFERGVHMVSTAADVDTTRRRRFASLEAPSCKPISNRSIGAHRPTPIGRLVRRPHRLNSDLSGDEKCSFEKLIAELNAAPLLRLGNNWGFGVDMTRYPPISRMETAGDAAAIRMGRDKQST